MRSLGGLTAALALTACAAPPPASAPLPAAPVPAGPSIAIEARAVPLDRDAPGRSSVGRFVYAGGLELASAETARLHGLSDLKVWPDGRLLAVSDEGDVLEARLTLDAAGRLVGLSHATLRPLLGEDGRPGGGDKARFDAEGIAEFPNGDRLVSFEGGDDRILLYPHAGGAPRGAPRPEIAYAANKGMEALALDSGAGSDAYLVGIEATGETWACRLSAACVRTEGVALPPDFQLTGLAVLPDGGRAWLLRAFDPLRGVRVRLRITDSNGALRDELLLKPPLAADNLEGVAVAPGREGLRFYLLSDDNFSSLQRTLLLAFDWNPQLRR